MSQPNLQPKQPQARPAIQALQPYSRAFASQEPPLYRSSSNESSRRPAKPVIDAVAITVEEGNRYPTLHADDLVDALATANRISADGVAVGDGSLSLLTYLLLAFTNHGDEIIYSWRSYEAYPIAVTAAGGVAVPVTNTTDGRHDLDLMASAVTDKTVAIIICSPNNPTGVAVSAAEMLKFLSLVPPRVLVILDQAYADFEEADLRGDPIQAEELLNRHSNLVLLRTFSKSFGLAGLRVGYLLTNPSIARPLKAIQPPFPVSRPAIAAAMASMADPSWRYATIHEVKLQRAKLDAIFRQARIPVTKSQANFIWLPLKGRAEEFARACSEERIAVRCFPDEGVRISLGEPGLVEALRRIVESKYSQ